MIPPLTEIVTSLIGAFRLARFDADGLAYFNNSLAGFGRSFFAAAIIAPFFVVLLIARVVSEEAELPVARYLALEAIAYVISWVAFPLVMVYLARIVGFQSRYLCYITAYNWCGVIQNAVYLPIAIFAYFGVIGTDLANTLALLALIWILAFTWFLARNALDLSAGTAAGIVGLDFLLGLVIDAVANRMI